MQNHRLEWTADEVPVSALYDDPFYSTKDGLAESRHVFLAGNDLPARFRSGFVIAELGFGTGLNALMAWHAWDQHGVDGVLRFFSFEAHPLTARDMARALKPFPELADRADALAAVWSKENQSDPLDLGSLQLSVVVGPATATLPTWNGSADAWFLDGFSPAKNPEMWSGALMSAVAQHTKPSGTFATYTAAGHVRRALKDAGFEVMREPGFQGKRHMTRGVL